jgi:hypothetical protein
LRLIQLFALSNQTAIEERSRSVINTIVVVY